MAVKTHTEIVKQRPLLKEGEPGFDPKRRLLNMNADPVPIGQYEAWDECTLEDLIEELGESAVADAARRQFNTDRRNAIAADHLNGGVAAEREAKAKGLAERAANGDAAALAELVALATKPRKRAV